MTEDDDYIECLGVHFAVCDYVDVLSELFKELKDVSKQVLGPCPKTLKEEVKKINDKRKESKKMEKDKIKKEADAQKKAVKELKTITE